MSSTPEKKDDVPAQLSDTETVPLRERAPEDARSSVPAPSGSRVLRPSVPADLPAGTPEEAALHEPGLPGTAGDGTAAPARRRGWLGRHWVEVVAGVVVVALLAGLAVSLLALRRQWSLDDARRSALKAGEQSAVALSSYDYRSLDRDFGAVTSRSTPSFRDSFTQTSVSLRKVLEQYDATATSTVVAAGVSSVTEKRAVVLVFLNQVATNTNQKNGPTTDQSRIEVSLARSGSAWLIDSVKLL